MSTEAPKTRIQQIEKGLKGAGIFFEPAQLAKTEQTIQTQDEISDARIGNAEGDALDQVLSSESQAIIRRSNIITRVRQHQERLQQEKDALEHDPRLSVARHNIDLAIKTGRETIVQRAKERLKELEEEFTPFLSPTQEQIQAAKERQKAVWQPKSPIETAPTAVETPLEQPTPSLVEEISPEPEVDVEEMKKQVGRLEGLRAESEHNIPDWVVKKAQRILARATGEEMQPEDNISVITLPNGQKIDVHSKSPRQNDYMKIVLSHSEKDPITTSELIKQLLSDDHLKSPHHALIQLRNRANKILKPYGFTIYQPLTSAELGRGEQARYFVKEIANDQRTQEKKAVETDILNTGEQPKVDKDKPAIPDANDAFPKFDLKPNEQGIYEIPVFEDITLLIRGEIQAKVMWAIAESTKQGKSVESSYLRSHFPEIRAKLSSHVSNMNSTLLPQFGTDEFDIVIVNTNCSRGRTGPASYQIVKVEKSQNQDASSVSGNLIEISIADVELLPEDFDIVPEQPEEQPAVVYPTAETSDFILYEILERDKRSISERAVFAVIARHVLNNPYYSILQEEIQRKEAQLDNVTGGIPVLQTEKYTPQQLKQLFSAAYWKMKKDSDIPLRQAQWDEDDKIGWERTQGLKMQMQEGRMRRNNFKPVTDGDLLEQVREKIDRSADQYYNTNK